MKSYTKPLVLILSVYLVGQIVVVLYVSRSIVPHVLLRNKINQHLLYQKERGITRDKRLKKHMYAQISGSAPVYIDDVMDLNMTSVHSFKQSLQHEHRIIKRYNNFTIRPPLFVDNTSRTLFYRNPKNLEAMRGRTSDELYGEIYIVRNGTLDVKTDCGFKSSTDWVHRNGVVDNINHWFPALVPISVPDGNTFQHFIDGVLPKLVQVLPLLQDKSVLILIKNPRDRIIYEMFDRLNVSSEQLVVENGDSVYGVDVFIYTCITPPLHPSLWQKARWLMRAPAQLQVPLKQAYIVLITRKGCYNCGRLILNQDELVNMLIGRYGSRLVKVFEGSVSLAESVELFGGARIILGPHGGGMYNINYAPSGTVVIEFMPTYDDGEMGAASHGIIWAMAQLLGQEY